MSEGVGEPLTWRDLSDEDVYYIAHLENDVRTQIGQLVATATMRTETSTAHKSIALAQQLAENHNLRSQLWLEDQATIRGRVAMPNQTGLELLIVPTQNWFDLRLRNISNKQLAATGVMSETDASVLRNGKLTQGPKSARPDRLNRIYRAILELELS